MSWFRPCLHESFCKTVKWHRVPVFFSSLVDQCSPCGTSSDYLTHVKVVTLRDCSRDVLGHMKSFGISADEAILSELKLLLARAGILFTFFSLRYSQTMQRT